MYGEALGRLIKGVLDDLHLDRQQREDSPGIVRRHLALLESRQMTNNYDSNGNLPLLMGVEPDSLTEEELDKAITIEAENTPPPRRKKHSGRRKAKARTTADAASTAA
jgi:hypothetical protein